VPRGDRSLITGTALIAGGHPDQLPYHLGRALENGVIRAELIEAITPSGVLHRRPNARSAATDAREVFDTTGTNAS
jgi:4-carboxymuconolactone decarboxylase